MGMMLDEAIELSKNTNNEVLFAYCGGINLMCLFNSKGSRSLCSLCKISTARILSQYNIKSVSLDKYCKEKVEDFKFNTSQQFRDLEYKGVKIGLSIMSSYISLTRNLSPNIDSSSYGFFNEHAVQTAKTVSAFIELLDEYKPDNVYAYNGRYEEARPIYDVCVNRGLKIYLIEGIRAKNGFEKLLFEDHLPHDIHYWCQRRDYCWDHYDMTEEEKMLLGKSFYEKRRKGIYAGDKIYIKDQIDGEIPPIDKAKINIGIMNSSEDEFAAVGSDWDVLRFFPTQIEGIEYMLSHADDNMHFYLRIHPNLKSIPYKYHTELLKLDQKYNNITVIPGDSQISTYTLMDHMDKIVSFGSTMSLESNYWGKPVINLLPAVFSYDELCYEPKDLDDLDRLLRADLKPIYNLNLIKYGAYVLNQEPMYIADKNITYNVNPHKFFNIKFHTVPYINFLGSEYITGLFIAILRYLSALPIFCKYKVPLSEE